MNTPSPVEQACAECGQAFHCAADSQPDKCWCLSYPAILPLNDQSGCLCPTCLKQRIIEALPKHLKNLSHENALALAANYSINGKLEEGIDYHMEDKLLVFSAWYHLKRGYCCGNGCRHCPYPVG